MRYDAAKKSVGVAYLLWFFVGFLGGHRFYLGSYGMGVVIVILSLLGFLTLGITFILSGLILLFDLFVIPNMIRRFNEKLIQDLR